MSPSEIEITTGTKKLNDNKRKLTDLVKNKDTVYVVARAKAGAY